MAVPELAYADRSTVDGFLTDDGLTMFFSSAPLADAGRRGERRPTRRRWPTPPADLFVAWRRSVNEPFSVTQPLDDLNTGGDERDPWLTPDGKTLYFTSDRDGVLNIYTAAVSRAEGAATSQVPGGCQPPSTTVGSRIIAASDSVSCLEPASRLLTLIALPEASTLWYSQKRSDEVALPAGEQPAGGRDRARHLAVDVGDVAGRVGAGVDARQDVARDARVGGQLRVDEDVAVGRGRVARLHDVARAADGPDLARSRSRRRPSPRRSRRCPR